LSYRPGDVESTILAQGLTLATALEF